MTAMHWFCHDHTMIMVKHGHDHAMMIAWQPCFFDMIAIIHGMIMEWSSCFACFCFKKNTKWIFFSIFFRLVAAMRHFMAHLTGFGAKFASKLPSQQNWTQLIPAKFRGFCDYQTAIPYLTIVSRYHIYYSFLLTLVISKFWERSSFL